MLYLLPSLSTSLSHSLSRFLFCSFLIPLTRSCSPFLFTLPLYLPSPSIPPHLICLLSFSFTAPRILHWGLEFIASSFTVANSLHGPSKAGIFLSLKTAKDVAVVTHTPCIPLPLSGGKFHLGHKSTRVTFAELPLWVSRLILPPMWPDYLQLQAPLPTSPLSPTFSPRCALLPALWNFCIFCAFLPD